MAENLIGGRYRLEQRLGHGGMSEVWAATDTELERRVAVKLLAPDADTARFEREARAVASLSHPNITQLYDYGEDAGRPYIVLEYLSGGTLAERLSDAKPLPDEQTWQISAELAAGLAHAHDRGVVHRDLKPANVLFDQDGRAKLADFGIARVAAGDGTLTEAGTVLGTAAYISPEQAGGEPASPTSDVYSFGVMLYQMLTGRLPFESSDAMELVTLHRDAEAPPVSALRADAPALLESTATAALAKSPLDRPADGAALLVALGIPTGLSSFNAPLVTAPADTEATRVIAPQPPRRLRGPLLAALVLGLALPLGGAALAYELTRPDSGVPADPTLLPAAKPPPHTHTTPTASLPTTTAPTTTAQTTTTQRATTRPATATTPPATTPPPATTVTPPPTTTTPPATTTEPPPTTTTDPTPPPTTDTTVGP